MATTPITINVAPASRTGTVKTSTTTYPGGYSSLDITLDGLGSGPGSAYENTANSVTLTFFIQPSGQNGFTPSFALGWKGKRIVRGSVVDPTPELTSSLANLAANTQVYVEIDITGTFTVGLTATLS